MQINLEHTQTKQNYTEYQQTKSQAYNEDCFELMKRIKDNSVNLIICDSPYFKICGKFDWQFKTMQEWIDWHILLRDEFYRILANNGSLFVFGDDKNIAYLQVEFDKKFNLLNNVIYRKTNSVSKIGLKNNRCFAPVTERILFYDKGKNKAGLEMIKKLIDNPFAKYLKDEFEKAGISNNEIAKICGVSPRLVSFWKNGDGSLIQESQYLKLRKYLNNQYLKKNYQYLKEEYQFLRAQYQDLIKEYEELRRPFKNDYELTDVIDCKVAQTFHPTTKDLSVIIKLINTTTKEGDLIFSPFLGSGTDRIAAHETKRNFIGCEINESYFVQSELRYQEHIKQLKLF